MTSLFFILAFFFALYELYSLTHTKELILKRASLSPVTKDNLTDGCLYVSLHMLYLIWGILGVALSSQWISFVILFFIGIAANLLGKAAKIADGDNRYLFRSTVIKMDAILSIIFLIDIFMVHFRGSIYPGILHIIFGF